MPATTVGATADEAWYTVTPLSCYGTIVALNLKNPEVEQLAEEVARLAGESKTEAVRQALLERRQRLVAHRVAVDRDRRLRAFLEDEVWPEIPSAEVGKRLSRREEDRILGYGRLGV
jgi:antitoxin VapB